MAHNHGGQWRYHVCRFRIKFALGYTFNLLKIFQLDSADRRLRKPCAS